MDLSELLHDNWFNLVIIFVLSFIVFIYKKRTENDSFDNIIKYADILGKIPHPQYQIDYLNNIKRKLIWEKVCFYKSGNIDKENIAISLVNADINNIIELSQLDLLTQYFEIVKNRITPLKPYLIKEILLSGVACAFAFIMLISNMITVFSSPWVINVIIAILSMFIMMIALFRFISKPIKHLKTYFLILKDSAFLQRANNELTKIVGDQNRDKEKETMNASLLKKITESGK
ncbi:hypothetical protein [Gilliamella mensalis]|uniref:hypothetical protein n=1 Tax=Gilliamella mensalis TaxID=1908520 RepID=UPI000A158315|nr:hypothetical protein [Gilliamella mensalis]